MKRPKALLHVCCAPCAAGPSKSLADAGWEPVLFFHNPNIHPDSELEMRRVEVDKLAKARGFGLISDSSGKDEWERTAGVLGPGSEGGARCRACFGQRLGRAAFKAAELGIPAFTTTLTASPHKNAMMVFDAGREAALEWGAAFLEYDFKKRGGFGESARLSRELGLSRQDYCGCRFSMDRPGRKK